MRIELISSMEAFTNLKEDWEAVYAADPDARFFLSWTWLSGWLRNTQKWFVLVAKRDALSPPVAFFPMRLRIRKTAEGEVIKEVAMAGNRVADYTGFICRPEYYDAVISAFATAIQKMKWDQVHLENICLSLPRSKQFLSYFSSKDYEFKIKKHFNKNDTTDNYVCPYVSLPECWETYLTENLSTNTRQKIRRFLRKIDGSSDMRITCATADTIKRDLDILLQLWIQKWSYKKPKNTLTALQSTYRTMLEQSFEAGLLFLPVCWNGEMPVGALASFIDRRKKSLLFFIGGRDETFKGFPSGFVLHAFSLRFGISNGFQTYDFMRGNEPYKYLFGCKERQVWYILISTRSTIASARGAPYSSAHTYQPSPLNL